MSEKSSRKNEHQEIRGFGKKEVLLLFKQRNLENQFPLLKSYLYSGAKVLDVGCGPGTITADIAGEVHPGSVVGIDPERSAIQQAIASAEKFQVENVTFQVGDTYSLEFEEESFDITYSHAVLEWVREPVRALVEQKRVTKRGGWVIAGIGSLEDQVIYPPCPAFEKFVAACSHLNDPSDMELFLHTTRSREAMALFSQAKLKDIKIEGYVAAIDCAYPGSKNFDYVRESLTLVLDLEAAFAPFTNKLIRSGVLDEETIMSAQREIEAWRAHPHAFHMHPKVLAAGRVDSTRPSFLRNGQAGAK